MPLIVPDARLVVDLNGPVLDRQARHRSQIRSESAVTTEQLPNEHAIGRDHEVNPDLGEKSCLASAQRADVVGRDRREHGEWQR